MQETPDRTLGEYLSDAPLPALGPTPFPSGCNATGARSTNLHEAAGVTEVRMGGSEPCFPDQQDSRFDSRSGLS